MNLSSTGFLYNESFVLAAIKLKPDTLGYVCDNLYHRVSFIMRAVETNGLCLEYCSVYRNTPVEEVICYRAVRQNGMALEFVREEMQKEYIVDCAAWNNWRCLQYSKNYVPSRQLITFILNLVRGKMRIATRKHLKKVLDVEDWEEGVWFECVFKALIVLRQTWWTKYVVNHKTNKQIIM